MRGYEDINQKGFFGWTPLGGKRDFFFKICLERFLDSSRCSFVKKSSKSNAWFYRQAVMDARTHKHESIGLSSWSRETNNLNGID